MPMATRGAANRGSRIPILGMAEPVARRRLVAKFARGALGF